MFIGARVTVVSEPKETAFFLPVLPLEQWLRGGSNLLRGILFH